MGLGYVGLPLAEAFSRNFNIVGFDTDIIKVKQLLNQQSYRQEATASEAVLESQTKDLNPITGIYPPAPNVTVTNNPQEISRADFIIICVPTPLTPSKEPDLSYVKNAARIAGGNMKKDAVVILESSVFPGVTEEIVKPILEDESKLKCGRDFKLGYSPERINPGDEEHTIDRITKVVTGMDEETTGLLAKLYGKICPKIFKARDIKTAEAAKLIENIQRDLNIALMNELAIIFGKMGVSTQAVIDAAATKWNFHRYSPGLVGGYCIPVSPYYFAYKARDLGYHPKLIPVGRAINDHMPEYIAEMTVKALSEVGKGVKGSRVLIMGLTYKENISYNKGSPVLGTIKELSTLGADVYSYDPLVARNEAEFGKKVDELTRMPKVDAIVLCVAHNVFKNIPLTQLKALADNDAVLIDIRDFYQREEASRLGFHYVSM